MIRADVEDIQAVEKGSQAFIEIGKQEAKEEEERHQRTMRNIKNFSKPFGGMIVTKETLHNALDAYKEWIEASFVDIEGRTTQTGKKQAERVVRIKRYAKEMPLSDFGTEEIDAIIEFWRTRPRKPATKKKSSEPYSFPSASTRFGSSNTSCAGCTRRSRSPGRSRSIWTSTASRSFLTRRQSTRSRRTARKNSVSFGNTPATSRGDCSCWH